MSCGFSSLPIIVGVAILIILLLYINCQNNAAAAASSPSSCYGSAANPGTRWRDDVAPRYPTVDAAPVGPRPVPQNFSAASDGLVMQPGWAINPVTVNQFEPEPPGTKLAKLGADVMNAAVKATEPLPPRFEPLPELSAQRMWQPVFQGCQSTFIDKACQMFYPNPRLWARDLSELQFRRALMAGQDNLVEPVRARQSYVQLLAAEMRSKKDAYTRATVTNDLTNSVCTQLAKQTPQDVSF